MEFLDSPDQTALRETTRSFLRAHAGPDRVRSAISGPTGYDTAMWARLTNELGLTALAVPESYGGVGASLAEVAVVVEELGRALVPSPYLSSVLVSAVVTEFANTCRDLAEQVLPGLAEGSLIGAFALDGDVIVTGARDQTTLSGTASHVVDGTHAGLLLVRASQGLYAVDAADANVTPLDTLDLTRGQATIRFDGCRGVLIGEVDDPTASSRAEDLLRVSLAVECVGGAEHCLDSTVAYLKTREQFGRPIGSFQALKHRCADLAVAVAASRSTARAAVWTAVQRPADLAVLAPLAILWCSRMFVDVTAEMIQLHGAIGFTWEHEAHLYFKRAKATQLLTGPPAKLRALVGHRAGLI
jgi:alkylation response protein AidB-like acyl-CoA dehydrogenase